MAHRKAANKSTHKASAAAIAGVPTLTVAVGKAPLPFASKPTSTPNTPPAAVSDDPSMSAVAAAVAPLQDSFFAGGAAVAAATSFVEQPVAAAEAEQEQRQPSPPPPKKLPPAPAPAPSTTPKPTNPKALASLSNRILRMVKRMGRTTYQGVADELVKELLPQVLRDEAIQEARKGGKNKKGKGKRGNRVVGKVRRRADASRHEKNIRRRVYDALNVMEATGVVAKDKREIVYVGIEGAARGEHIREAKEFCEEEQLLQRRDDLQERVRLRQEELVETVLHFVGCRNLHRRNCQHGRLASASAAPEISSSADGTTTEKSFREVPLNNGRIPLPFLTASVPDSARVEIIHQKQKGPEGTVTGEYYRIKFSEPFVINDDHEILKNLGLCTTTAEDLQQWLQREAFEYMHYHGLLNGIVTTPMPPPSAGLLETARSTQQTSTRTSLAGQALPELGADHQHAHPAPNMGLRASGGGMSPPPLPGGHHQVSYSAFSSTSVPPPPPHHQPHHPPPPGRGVFPQQQVTHQYSAAPPHLQQHAAAQLQLPPARQADPDNSEYTMSAPQAGGRPTPGKHHLRG